MSRITETSPRHCANRDTSNKKRWLCVSLPLSILSFILLVWLILHPTKPQFSLKEADVYNLTLSGPCLLNSSIQITLSSVNPNTKLGIYYDELVLHALYQGQRITTEAYISPFYQDHEETNLMSASLVGDYLPVASLFVDDVLRDQPTGKIAFNFRVVGLLRWRVGTWTFGKYRFLVNCVTIMPLGNAPMFPLSSKKGSRCSTTL